MSSSTGRPSAPTAIGTRSRLGRRCAWPRGVRVVPVQVGDAEQGGQLEVGGQRLDASAPAPSGTAARSAGPAPAPRRAEPVRRGPAVADRSLRLRSVRTSSISSARDVEPQCRAAGPPGQRPGEVEHRRRCGSPAPVEAVARGDLAAVEDDDRERLVAAGRGRRRRSRGRSVNSAPSRSSSSLAVGRDQPDGPGAVRTRAGAGRAAATSPSPTSGRRSSRRRRNAMRQVAGGVQRRRAGRASPAPVPRQPVRRSPRNMHPGRGRAGRWRSAGPGTVE